MDLYLKMGFYTAFTYDVFGPSGINVGIYGQWGHQRMRLGWDFVRITAAGHLY